MVFFLEIQKVGLLQYNDNISLYGLKKKLDAFIWQRYTFEKTSVHFFP